MLALQVLFLVLGLVPVGELEVQGVLWGRRVVELGQEGQQVEQQSLL